MLLAVHIKWAGILQMQLFQINQSEESSKITTNAHTTSYPLQPHLLYLIFTDYLDDRQAMFSCQYDNKLNLHFLTCLRILEFMASCSLSDLSPSLQTRSGNAMNDKW